MSDKLGPVLWTILALLAVYIAQTLRRWRYMRLEQFAEYPQLAKPSPLWGHMRLIGELYDRGDPRRHIDIVLSEALEEAGNPPVALFDLRPVSYPMMVIANHEVAEQITKASSMYMSSVPKSPTFRDIQHLTGQTSILTDEGEHWKSQRRRLNPGFAPQHLLTTLPIILDKAEFFISHLERHASAGDEFALDKLCTNLTFDIIGAVTMGQDLKAQIPGQQSELLTLFVNISLLYQGNTSSKIPGTDWFKERRRRRFATRIDSVLKDVVRSEHARAKTPSSSSPSSSATTASPPSRSVLALSLQGTDALNPELLQQTADNLRVFMFAGHDTTSILMQWALYELSRHPHARTALTAELDALFGSGPDDVAPENIAARLRAPGGAELLAQMPYVTAVIKETLRLHPPAGSARMSPPGSNFQIVLPSRSGEGKEEKKVLCADGCILYLSAYLMQRDKSVWGEDAAEFVPERWLGDGASSMPAGSWRPFERGPRSCIGLELANIEAKVILALVVRRYDFVKVGIGAFEMDGDGRPVLNEKGYYRTTTDLFNSIQVTAKPVDGTMVKVKLSEQATRQI